MKKIVLLICFLAIIQASAQAQSYSFIKSTGTYTDLTAPTVLTTANWDDGSHNVPIGFSFNYAGTNYTSVDADENGLVFFNYNDNLALIAIITDLQQSGVQSPSEVSYQLTGSAGSRVLKIEWRNAGFWDGLTTDFVNFQVWLHEGSNKIDTHFGPVSIANSNDVFYLGSIHGLIVNYNFADDTFSGPFLTGDPLNPTLVNYVNDTIPAPMLSHPTNGLIYTFTPLLTGLSKNPEKLNLSLYPNPATEAISIEGLDNKPATIKVFDRLGKLVLIQEQLTGNRITVDLTTLKPGTYAVEVIAGNKHFSKPIVKL